MEIFQTFVRVKQQLAKYLFALFTCFYITGSSGIPVYLHYCGGELEKVSYVFKTSSCCGDEESAADDSCCKDEGFVVRSAPDARLSQVQVLDNARSLELLWTPVQELRLTDTLQGQSDHFNNIYPPPLLRHTLVRCSVLRI